MEDPVKDIERVIDLVTAAVNPEVQKAAVLRYYAPDAGFRHPLCAVSSGPNSRDQILGVLQWYRVMSPHLKIEVRNATYNPSTNEMFVEVVQVFHIRWNPLPAAPSRLMVHLVLRPSDEDPKLYQIALHEDFYHPGDLAALMVPPLIPVIKLLHKFGTVASVVNARLFGFFGFWTVNDKEGSKSVDVSPPQGGPEIEASLSASSSAETNEPKTKTE